MTASADVRGVTRWRDTVFEWGRRTYVMGILNVTPDSFSGDSLGRDVEAAVAQARRFVETGADILDIGGESTRPGHAPISIDEEMGRVLPALRAVRRAVDVPISIDTYKLEVAAAAVDEGADVLNDIWGLKRDARLARLAAERGLPVILMHNQEGTSYQDLLGEMMASLRHSCRLAVEAGVPEDRIVVDPGIGFGKDWLQNLEVLRRLGEFRGLGHPILLGTSRKSTIGRVLGGLPPEERVEGTAATVALGIGGGADIVRVHDVAAMVRVTRMADAVVRGNVEIARPF